MQKNNKGITLIALVVTIIVMIILASITVTALTGKKSTINQATDTTENAQRESIIEKIEADLLQEKIKTGNMPTKEDLKTLIQENGYNKGNLEENSFITKDGEYTIYYEEIIGWQENQEESKIGPEITIEQEINKNFGIKIKITDDKEIKNIEIQNPDDTTLANEENISKKNFEFYLFDYCHTQDNYQNGIYTIIAEDAQGNSNKKQLKIQWLLRPNNEYTEITGGWNSNYFKYAYGDIPNIIYSKENGVLLIGANPNKGYGRLGTWYTNNAIDMSGYDYLVDQKYATDDTTQTGTLQLWAGEKTTSRKVSERRDSGYIGTVLDISDINDKEQVITGINGLETDYYSMFISNVYMYKVL